MVDEGVVFAAGERCDRRFQGCESETAVELVLVLKPVRGRHVEGGHVRRARAAMAQEQLYGLDTQRAKAELSIRVA